VDYHGIGIERAVQARKSLAAAGDQLNLEAFLTQGSSESGMVCALTLYD
jgi:hypothetical protein